MPFLFVARQQIAMQQVVQLWPKRINPQLAPSHDRRQGPFQIVALGLASSVLAILGMSAILNGKDLPAQTPARQQKAIANSAQPNQPVAEATVVQLPASSDANHRPNQAKVSWGSRGLEIKASNSSLNEILQRISVDTGAKLEGLAQDQRVFGNY